jgi:uncharacterized protein YbaP (TraB family)
MSRFFFLVCAVCLGFAAQPADASEKNKRAQGTEQLKQRPAAAQVVRPPIVQDYDPDPAIWLLQDEDTRIYLFGTIHLLPEGFRWRNPRLDSIAAAADELVVETADESEDEQALAALLGDIEGRTPVSERMSPENGKKWRSMARFAGMKPDDFDRLPPILALFGTAMAYYDSATGADHDFGVETTFETEFRAAGKPIGSIEKGSDVVASLLAIDEAMLIGELERELAEWDGSDPADWLSSSGPDEAADEDPLADEHDWARGAEMDMEDEFQDGTELGPMLAKLLLEDRNAAWSEWLAQRLDRPGNVLVAVGAAHLAGASSVQNHLLERGLRVERLNPAR